MRTPTWIRKPSLLLLLLFPLLIFGQQSLVTTAPAPEWIEAFPFDTIKSPFNFDREHMHEERQINIESREEYIRHMYRIDSYDGIFNFHEIEFYPLFQNISIHTATIYRQDSVLNFIPNLRIYLDEKSKFSGNQLYLKTAQAKFFIENMRVGDYVEIAYTIHGFQKELKRKYATYAGPKAKTVRMPIFSD